MRIFLSTFDKKHKKTTYTTKHRHQNEKQTGDAPLHSLGHRRVGVTEAYRTRLKRARPSGYGQRKDQQPECVPTVHR